jgi:ribose transport system substrate-binding protein
MYCKQCKTQNDDYASFCRGCGNDLKGVRRNGMGKRKKSKGIRFLVILITFTLIILIALTSITFFDGNDSIVNEKEAISNSTDSVVIEKEILDKGEDVGNSDSPDQDNEYIELQNKIADAKDSNLIIAIIMWSKYYSSLDRYYQGAIEAGDKYGMEVIFFYPTVDFDKEQQMNLMNEALDNEVDAICISPFDNDALKSGYEESVRLGIPIINTSANWDTQYAVSKVCLNYYQAGEIAAHEMARKMNGDGEVAIIYTSLLKNLVARADGFIDTINNDYPNIKIVASQDTIGTITGSETATKSVLEMFPNIDGFYGSDNECTVGIVNAVKSYNKTNNYILIGSGPQKEFLSSGEIDGTVEDDLFNAGYKAIETASLCLFDMKVDKIVLYDGLFRDKNDINN